MAVTEFRTSINDYLEQLPSTTTLRLYSKPATCLAIFRLLPSLAKHFIMSMLFSNQQLSMTAFESWCSPAGTTRQAQAFEKLSQLNILKESSVRGGPSLIDLNPLYRKNLKLALKGGGNHNSFGLPAAEAEETPDVAFLDQIATETWENILHFMVGTTLSAQQQPGRSVVSLLQHSGLWTTQGITSAGFQFLLQDSNAQVWSLILQYLETSDISGADPVEMIHFLFMLGNMEVGQAYSTRELSEQQAALLLDLRDFGIVFHEEGSDRYFPTRLALILSHDAKSTAYASTHAAMHSLLPTGAGGHRSQEDTGFVILETNYKLYAYTASPLQIAVLDLFCSLTMRFPNMVAGVLSRESIRRALDNGISADQVILYLQSHAHPQMRIKKPREPPGLLPPTVVDQIRLWELEKNRLKATPGYLFRDFKTGVEFEEALQYARDIGVLVYEHPGRRMFFVGDGGQTAVAAYIRRRTEAK
ncbi:transcription factor TFIIH complex subunit Tfb2 [Protomyces lactucae-debilis]|uniref:RNA polymerase II transcription factor B subunit 2 n=1 Tax=Protomyces lactucae-debilis TaxID=2754530 RepID=A0A1Y2F8S0_PROLT|nr:transcription factor TFIIH complex subunit Tfb2 [Protomyces lactucae-debilis]ORY79854.1 transcription factor TFIIH complex subunit Tfb2 [Protomyces lactucae-debilis]